MPDSGAGLGHAVQQDAPTEPFYCAASLSGPTLAVLPGFSIAAQARMMPRGFCAFKDGHPAKGISLYGPLPERWREGGDNP